MKYHAAIGFPSNLRRPTGVATLVYSEHALTEAASDRYGHKGVIVLPKRINLDAPNSLIEVEALADGTLLKGVYRVRYNALNDLVLVIVFGAELAFVRTIWLNRKGDNHAALRYGAYDEPSVK